MPVIPEPLKQIEQLVGKLLVDAKVEQLFALQRLIDDAAIKLKNARR